MSNVELQQIFRHIKPREFQKRYEDMSPDGRLSFIMEDDGDVILSIYDGERKQMASVQFCTTFGGGGQSPRVREAILRLALAIKLDNDEAPQDRERKTDEK